MPTIYVAGQISDKNLDKATGWRKEVHEWADLRGDIKILDPLVGKKVGDITNRVFTPNEIVLRDLKDIDESDFILANLSDLVADEPLFGTPCEIMYAWVQGIPVILVTDQKRLQTHYWTNVLCARILPDLTQALAYIEKYWLRDNGEEDAE